MALIYVGPFAQQRHLSMSFGHSREVSAVGIFRRRYVPRYRGHDTVIDRPVVVKLLTIDACKDVEAKARFLQEARLAGNIQHENIVSVFDFGEHDGRPFIVMEYLKGEDLRDAIRGGRTGSMMDRMKIALKIAQALEYVHSRGIVHRDIKPENVHIDPAAA